MEPAALDLRPAMPVALSIRFGVGAEIRAFKILSPQQAIDNSLFCRTLIHLSRIDLEHVLENGFRFAGEDMLQVIEWAGIPLRRR